MRFTNPRGLVLVTLGVGALCVAAPDAHAKAKGRKNRPERLELASGTADPDASGTLEVRTARRGPDAVLRVRNLEPRNDYLVVDGTSGETLGTLDTNRRGRGRFAFGAKQSPGKRRGVDGTDANVPDEVRVVDAETGETVLEGDVPGGREEPDYDYAYGFGDYESGNGDFASVVLSSFPEFDSESFYLSFFPMPAEDDEDACWCVPYYDYVADTSMGDELPLGVETASDLAGRAFRIVDADGNAVLRGELPEMEEFDYDFPPCPGWDDKPYPGDDDDGDGDDNTDPTRPGHMDGGPMRGDGANGMRGNTRRGKAGALPDGGVRGDPTDGGNDDGDEPAEFRLEIEGDDGEFVDVGALNAWDPCDDWFWAYPEDDGGFWEGDWNWDYEWDWSDEWSYEWTDEWSGDWTDEWMMTGNGVVFVR